MINSSVNSLVNYPKDSEYVYFIDTLYEKHNQEITEHIKNMNEKQINIYLHSEEYQDKCRYLRTMQNYGPIDRTYHIENRGVKKKRGSKNC